MFYQERLIFSLLSVKRYEAKLVRYVSLLADDCQLLAGCMGNDDSAVTELENEITIQDEKIADLEAEVATLTTQHQGCNG